MAQHASAPVRAATASRWADDYPLATPFGYVGHVSALPIEVVEPFQHLRGDLAR